MPIDSKSLLLGYELSRRVRVPDLKVTECTVE